MGLTKGNLRFFQFLKTQTAGMSVTQQTILAATNWTESSFKTIWGKHKLDSFLSKEQNDRYKILKAGPLLTEAEVEAAMTQVAPAAGPKPIVAGQVLKGQKDRYTLVARLGNGAVGHVWSASSANTTAVGSFIL